MSTNDFTNSPRPGEPFPPPETDPEVLGRETIRPNTRPLTPVDPTQPTHRETDGHHEPGSESSGGPEAASKAKDLAREGQHSAEKVMDSAKQEASMVAEQARDKASHLLDELGADVRIQASEQQRKVAANLRDISNEFRQMLDSSQTHGTATNLVDQAADQTGRAAEWLDTREPGDLVDELKGFARRKPMAFLGIALGAGLLAGRITRNAASSDKSTGSTDPNRARTDTGSLPGNVPTPPPPVSEVDPLPPQQGGTIGAGGIGGTGVDHPGLADPGTTYPPSTPRRTDFE